MLKVRVIHGDDVINCCFDYSYLMSHVALLTSHLRPQPKCLDDYYCRKRGRLVPGLHNYPSLDDAGKGRYLLPWEVLDMA